jgi:hypothetical protein
VLGRPTQVSGFVNSISYFPSGQINQIIKANGTTTTYGQNSRLWPSSFQVSKSSTGYLSSSYSYDGVGNTTTISDTVDASYNRSLGYDSLNRLANASGPWGAGSMTYDGVGNLRSQTLGSTSLSYAYSNNLLASVGGSRSATYSYDAYGDIIGTGTQAHTYDGSPNMTCANCNDPSTKTVFQYDGLNQRVSVQKAAVKTYEFYGSSGNLLSEYTPAAGNKLVEYIHLGGKRIAQLEPAQTSIGNPASSSLRLVAGRPGVIAVTINGNSPTGTVSVYDGSTLLGTAALVSGTASVSVTIVNGGTHNVSIVYSGDANNAASSSTVALNVTLAPEVLMQIMNLILDDDS